MLNQFKHVMIDIETLGNTSKSVITSIGAVLFDPKAGVHPDWESFFYKTISIEDSLKRGLHVDGSTIEWWFGQEKEAQLAMFKGNPQSLEYTLEDFTSWIRFHGGAELIMWGNSPRFDLGLIQDAYLACGLSRPWDFRKERDQRTLLSLVPGFDPKSIAKVGASHIPVNDCNHQIKLVMEAYRLLGL